MSNAVAPHAGIGAESTMAELIDAYPGARRALFAKYHIGGCQSCGYEMDETLGDVCARNEDLPVQEALDHVLESAAHDAKVYIAPKSLADFMATEKNPRLLDTRTREEYEAVHLPDAVLLTQEGMGDIFGSWPMDTPVVVYDHTGDKAIDAAAYLTGHGFTNVRALEGGIDAFAQQVDPEIPRYKVEFE